MAAIANGYPKWMTDLFSKKFPIDQLPSLTGVNGVGATGYMDRFEVHHLSESVMRHTDRAGRLAIVMVVEGYGNEQFRNQQIKRLSGVLVAFQRCRGGAEWRFGFAPNSDFVSAINFLNRTRHENHTGDYDGKCTPRLTCEMDVEVLKRLVEEKDQFFRIRPSITSNKD